MSQHLSIFAALAAPFAADEVRTRNQAGRDLQYVTARTVMNRLDEVLGPENWWDEYTPMENAVICKLTVRLPDGSTVTKSDAGGFTTTADTSDYEKTGFSDAFKRAAVKYGVSRYLYGDGVPPSIRQALIREKMAREKMARENPALPAPDREPLPALAGGAPDGPPTGPRRDRDDDQGEGPSPGPAPKTGKALFAWVKERDEKLGVDLLRAISDWGKEQHYPVRMVQWAGDQVDHAHSEALRLLTTLKSSPEDANAGRNRPGRPAERRGGR